MQNAGHILRKDHRRMTSKGPRLLCNASQNQLSLACNGISITFLYLPLELPKMYVSCLVSTLIIENHSQRH